MAFWRHREEAKDILQTKEARLAELKDESNFALTMVKDTIENLEAVNADIAETRDEIDTYMRRLTATREGLSTTLQKNAQIMQNFKNLLCME